MNTTTRLSLPIAGLVMCCTIVAQDTVDEDVMQALAGKARTQQQLLDHLRRTRRKSK